MMQTRNNKGPSTYPDETCNTTKDCIENDALKATLWTRPSKKLLIQVIRFLIFHNTEDYADNNGAEICHKGIETSNNVESAADHCDDYERCHLLH